MSAQLYEKTAATMLQIGADVFATSPFALKGGTAINFFVQNMPRFSVDLDLVFVPRDINRAEALATINKELRAISRRLTQRGFSVEAPPTDQAEHTKLYVRHEDIEVKIEVNHVFRGTLLPVQQRSLAPAAAAAFGSRLEVPMLAIEELYGGKLVAAMDRQHPRDIFDVKVLFDTIGLSTAMVDCFVAYLAGHHRPVHEVISPRDKDLKPVFIAEFLDMPREPVSLEALENTRARLKLTLQSSLMDNHKAFLLGLLSGNPPWDALPFPGLSSMPALRWKMLNLAKLRHADPARHCAQVELLEKALDASNALQTPMVPPRARRTSPDPVENQSKRSRRY